MKERMTKNFVNKQQNMDTQSVKSIVSVAKSNASNEKKNSCKAHELLAEAKRNAKLMKSKLLKKTAKMPLRLRTTYLAL